MTQFEIMAAQEITCEICGGIMLPMYGGGWDNDRMVCAERDCQAEIEFPTSTEVEGERNMSDDDIVHDPYLDEYVYDHVAYDNYSDAIQVREEDRAIAKDTEQGAGDENTI